jgi:hypothetical protein
MRTVTTRPPSFPEAATEALLQAAPGVRWQVLCGDAGHWRLGIYSPAETSAADLVELERHDCPELFLLLDGELTLLVAEVSEGGRTRELPLVPGRPVLVTAPHGGFCPRGPHSGRALVVERDAFDTEYRTPGGW